MELTYAGNALFFYWHFNSEPALSIDFIRKHSKPRSNFVWLKRSHFSWNFWICFSSLSLISFDTRFFDIFHRFMRQLMCVLRTHKILLREFNYSNLADKSWNRGEMGRCHRCFSANDERVKCWKHRSIFARCYCKTKVQYMKASKKRTWTQNWKMKKEVKNSFWLLSFYEKLSLNASYISHATRHRASSTKGAAA